jgi:hypothetical protein
MLLNHSHINDVVGGGATDVGGASGVGGAKGSGKGRSATKRSRY